MADEDKRAATDILLSIEAKLITLDKRIQNSEYLLKNLLGKANKAQSVPPPVSSTVIPKMAAPYPIDVINKDNFESRPKTNRFSEIAASQGLDLDDLPNTYVAKPADNGGDMVEASKRGTSRGQRGLKPGSKSTVTQVLNRGNEVVFLANIEVLDGNNELVSQTRTDNKGRWMMSLAPGDYQVHLTKRFPPDSGKKSIDTSYQISIPPSDIPLELDPFVVDMG
jgi:hypothetical protein